MYQYPYGNAQQLNLDWILSKIQELQIESGAVNLEDVSKALIAEPFSSDQSYRQFDYAFYNGKLYRALNDTSGAFDPDDWREVLIGEDIPVLTRLLNAVDASLTTLQGQVADLDSSDVDNVSTVSGATVTDALDSLLNGKLDKAATYSGATDLDSVVNYALSLNIVGKPFAFQANYDSGSTGFFNVSAFTVVCFFSSINYGYGLMFSDQSNVIALFRRAASVNILVPIAHTSQITDNVQFSLNSANKSYAIGECFVFNGDLYRVTTAISSGSPITIGTNAVKTTLDTAIQDNYAFDSIPFVAAAGVSSSASFDRTGNMLSGVGYINVTTAVGNGGAVGSVALSVRKRQQFVCVNINNHDAFAIYYNTDGSVTAPEGLAVGYYRIIGPIII